MNAAKHRRDKNAEKKSITGILQGYTFERRTKNEISSGFNIF